MHSVPAGVLLAARKWLRAICFLGWWRDIRWQCGLSVVPVKQAFSCKPSISNNPIGRNVSYSNLVTMPCHISLAFTSKLKRDTIITKLVSTGCHIYCKYRLARLMRTTKFLCAESLQLPVLMSAKLFHTAGYPRSCSSVCLQNYHQERHFILLWTTSCNFH